MGSIEAKSFHFKELQNFKSDYTTAEFTQYESQRTGMRVVVVDRKGPKVYGYFALATEIHDDSGAPHTLEHLCFMGSRSYPYKGVLDKIATRSYSNTNAWTATDHTAYTLDTAGWEGFAQILPIYLDHVILPTLTDAGCYTEVWHIDGTGNDAGVVYSEMQGVQNDQAELMDLKSRRILYPEGDGFRYETGGMMEQLRVLTADRIREFHKEMYQPKNLRLVLIGEVDHENLLDILDKFEDGIQDSVPSYDAPFKRPWVESKQTPALSKTTVDTVEFPEEDESYGEVLITFLGPKSTSDVLETALHTILTYLAGSSASVLVNKLVEQEEVASEVYYYVENRLDMVISFSMSSVATEKLAHAEKRFFEVLREHADGPLDMPYLKDCLHRFKRQVLYGAEASNTVFKDPIIEDHLFGNRDGSNMFDSLATLRDFDELERWSEEDWCSFLKKWISDAHHVSILGTPSAKLSEKLKKEEVARVKAQQEKLGEEGLEKLAKKLEEAKAENDKPIPDEILEGLKIPGTESIHFFETITARSGLAKRAGALDNKVQKIVDQDENGLPLFIHFEHLPTNFVHFSLVLCTGSIPLHLKPLIIIYLTNFFTTPIMRDGKRIEFEQVITELEKDTIEYAVEQGKQLGNSELIRIKFVVEPEKFETAVKWLKTMLKDSIFDEARLKTTVAKMLADIPDEKRDGNDMAASVDAMLHYAPQSTIRASNTLVKALYLKKLRSLLRHDPKHVISLLEDLRSHLATFSNMRILCITNLEKTKNPVSTFKHLTDAIPPPSEPSIVPIDSRKANLSEASKNPGSLTYIVPMSTIDSSFALLTARGPDSYTHPSLPVLMVAVAYLDAVEGPMWTSIRGTGLAYGTGFSKAVDTGLLGFRIYRSPDAFKAWKTAKDVVGDFVSGKKEFERLALEGAISSCVVEFVDEQTTGLSAAKLGFVNQVVRGIPKDYSDMILKKVREVKVEDIKKVMVEYVQPVFEVGKSDVVVSCASIMEENLKANFETAGFKPQVQPLSFFQDDYGLEAPEDDEDDEDDEDEDEDDETGDEEEE